MQTTRLSSKGQVIIPKSLRELRHWGPGMEFEVEDRPEGILLKPKRRVTTMHVEEIIGCSGYRGCAKSLEEMEAAIAQGVNERHARGRY